MPGPYISVGRLGSAGAGGLPSTPMKARPEDIDWVRLMDPSMLVGGVIHPPSYMPGMPPWTPYIMLLLLLLLWLRLLLGTAWLPLDS